MHSYKEYWNKIIGDDTKERAMEEIVCGALEKLKMHCPDLFYRTLYDLHCVAYGPHFDEALAKLAVSKMQNTDGTNGEHWTYEQTNQLAEQHNIKHKADWYYVLNMVYSDYGAVFSGDTGTLVKIAKAYMCDPDAPSGKVLDLWVAQMRAKERQ
ncbi:MAG: hypothetical protein U0O09_04440 [Phascolarctobacterium sp.]|jgi:hypothetical protein|nr:MAG TPA: hypothetical protein [Caudoviricetes sp.]DAY48016.1 MAG TPA: hypothetical protein [Caudoviricetes sp.]DAY56023.1 MAG TPA: hypothetical protein [Caudoviricetes sp.]